LADWKVESKDLDNDNVPEVLVYDDEGLIRKVNGWGVKESAKPIRDDYYSRNPTSSDRKNITQGEWTNGIQVDRDGNIGYMFPQAVRYKKSRQAYYAQHEDKIPKPDLKKVWQQYVAKPFILMSKSNAPGDFKDLNALPGMAAAALSQYFTTHGFMLLKLRSFTAGSKDDQKNQLADVMANLILEGEYGDEAYEQLRKDNTKTFKNFEKMYPGYANNMHEVVISLANIISESNSVNDLLNSEQGGPFQELVTLLENTYHYIVKEYAEDGRENTLVGRKRIANLYKRGRTNGLGELVDDIRNQEIQLVRPDLAKDSGRAAEREETRRRRAQDEYKFYQQTMSGAGYSENEYPFREAWEEWAYNHKRNMTFPEFIMRKIGAVKNR